MGEVGVSAMPHGLPGAVTVVGLGLMGGSVVKSLRRAHPEVPVYGIEPDPGSAGLAAGDGVRIVDSLDRCPLAGGVVLFATPLDTTVALVGETAAEWSTAALATDVASLKAPVLDAAAAQGPWVGGTFVGAHPMTGSERSGYAAARADLFDGADVWITPCGPVGADRDSGAAKAVGDANADAVRRASAFWRVLGARPRVVGAEEHDRVMTWASHLPQLVASALAGTLADAGIPRAALGPGGRDATRIAGSNPGMWTPLLRAAAAADARALATLEDRIGAIRGMLERGDMEGVAQLLEQARHWCVPGD
ncbi:MAG: prephenate dehydrogenase/arogenate dehydrogenase family protein [Gemmatimonadetes bacterium]|nr:prephenate dehydrogenase/arogenate dehydrogenase family protein [Gemmatimonadota bacterium]